MSLAALMLPVFQMQAQNQTNELAYQAKVYGMVCNQCAYGVEQALLNTDGIQSATVNLKDGNVKAVLKVNSTTPAAATIVKSITDQGITVKKLKGTLEGTVSKENGRYYFTVGETNYLVKGNTISDSVVGKRIQLTGTFKGVKGMEDAQKDDQATFWASNLKK